MTSRSLLLLSSRKEESRRVNVGERKSGKNEREKRREDYFCGLSVYNDAPSVVWQSIGTGVRDKKKEIP